MKKFFVSLLGLMLLLPFTISTNVSKAATNVDSSNNIVAVSENTLLYSKNNDGSFTQIANRMLSAKSTWRSDKIIYSEDGTSEYYRVSTNEWVKYVSGQTNTIIQGHNYQMNEQVDNYANVNAKVITIADASAPIYNDFGENTGKTLSPDTSWKVDMHYSIAPTGLVNYRNYQRVGTNQWISMDDAKVSSIL